MSRFTRSLAAIAASAGKAFARFPAAMTSALVIALSASWLIQLDAVSYDKNYQSLQLGFLVAAALGMAVTAAGAGRRTPLRFLLLNLTCLAAGLGLFFLIKSPAGDIPELTVFRVLAAAAVLVLVFLLLISRAGTGSTYSQASFMTLKSALIALLYGLVILLGLYFIAFTVQSLLYEDMSSKVYQHVAVWSAFLGFTFFLGYFPDFTAERPDPHLETTQKQPRFVEILFLYVLVPLLSVLTAVLLAWAVQILIVREWPAFSQLTAILSAYALTGIWLFIMIAESPLPAARFYRRAFPPALLVLLAFEAYALVERFRAQSVKPAEYVVTLIWLFALVSALLFLRGRAERGSVTAVTGIILLAVAVLPLIGYQDVSVFAQSRRLQAALMHNQMLAGDRIQPAPAGISDADKVTISDAARFLLEREGARTADWFERSISSMNEFRRVFGFEETYPGGPGEPMPGTPRSTNFILPQGSIPISGYQLLLYPSDTGSGTRFEARGTRGLYGFSDDQQGYDGVPVMNVLLDGHELFQVDFRPFFDSLAARHPGIVDKGEGNVTMEEMILRTEQGGLRLMFVFSYIRVDQFTDGSSQYPYTLHSIYIAES